MAVAFWVDKNKMAMVGTFLAFLRQKKVVGPTLAMGLDNIVGIIAKVRCWANVGTFLAFLKQKKVDKTGKSNARHKSSIDRDLQAKAFLPVYSILFYSTLFCLKNASDGADHHRRWPNVAVLSGWNQYDTQLKV